MKEDLMVKLLPDGPLNVHVDVLRKGQVLHRGWLQQWLPGGRMF